MVVPSFDFGVDVMPLILGAARKMSSRADPEPRCGLSANGLRVKRRDEPPERGRVNRGLSDMISA
jgi:hypothetical protein